MLFFVGGNSVNLPVSFEREVDKLTEYKPFTKAKNYEKNRQYTA